MTASTIAQASSPELVPYTADDYSFIEEITADHPPIDYKPKPSLIPVHVRMQLRSAHEVQALSESYSFPWSSPIGAGSQADLAAQLDEVVLKIQDEPWGYIRNRDLYCMLALSLNELGLQAPAFRPSPTIPWLASEQTAEHLLIQRDRIAIDCHWLYCTKSRVYASEGNWSGLVNPKLGLQMTRIEKFAATKLSNDYRADDLMGLTELQQAQMAAIKSAKMQENFKALGAMVVGAGGVRTASRFKRIDRAIREWCSSQPRFEKHYGKYRAYARAVELLDRPSVQQIATLAGYIAGEKPLSESSARQTLAVLRRLISGI